MSDVEESPTTEPCVTDVVVATDASVALANPVAFVVPLPNVEREVVDCAPATDATFADDGDGDGDGDGDERVAVATPPPSAASAVSVQRLTRFSRLAVERYTGLLYVGGLDRTQRAGPR